MDSRADRELYERLAKAHATWRETPATERATWLDELEQGDPQLARELRELLNASSAGEALFDNAAIEDRGGMPPIAHVLPKRLGEPPEAIGPFRILGLLGSGGMGVVYEAEEQSPRRRVALKVVHAELAHGVYLRRFQHEAEAQGRLKHPGIAQVYGTGVCDLGRGEQPYMVMELVEGDALLVHANKERLDVRARLKLVSRLCDAMQHAHEHGVIHRDLKPDNVLLDLAGQPKVLDFGIARVVTGKAPLTTIHTAHGNLVGTITHMAPEQLGGDPDAVGPATDVYALGVIAFELLTDRLPHDVAGLPISQAARQIMEEEAPRLGRLDRSLRGDVETMIGKALEREPVRRYVSAAAFAADLRRYLSHHPIAARRPSAVYRGVSFARRHRGLVTGAALALIATLAGTFGVLRYAERESEMRVEAERLGVESRATGYAAIDTLLSSGEDWKAHAQLQHVPDALRGWEWAWLSARAPLELPGRVGWCAAWGEGSLLATKTHGRWGDVFVHDIADLTRPPLRVEGLDDVGNILAESGRVHVQGRLRAGEGWTASPYQSATGILDVDRGRFLEIFRHESWDKLPMKRGDAFTIRPGGYHAGSDLLVLIKDEPVPRTESTLGLGIGEVQVVTAATSEARRRTRRYAVHYPGAGKVAFDAQAELAVVTTHAGYSGPVVIVRVDGWQEIGRIEGTFEIPPAIHPDGTELAFAYRTGSLEIFGIPGLELKRRMTIDPADGVKWTSDGRLVTSGFGGIFFRDPETGRVLEEVRTEHRGEQWHVHPNGRLIAGFGGNNDDLKVYELGAAPPSPYVELRGHGTWIYPCAFSPDGDLIASSSPIEPEILVWDGWSGALLARLPRAVVPAGNVSRTNRYAPLFFTSDGSELVTTEHFGTNQIRLLRYDLLTGTTVEGLPRLVGDWNVASGERLTELLDAFGDADGSRMRKLNSQLAIHPDGRQIITANLEGTLVRAPSGEERRIDDAEAVGVSVSPDGSLLAIGELDQVRIVSLPSGRPVATALESPEVARSYYAVAYSPDGSRLAVGDGKGNLQLLETRYYRRILDLPRHSGYVYSLAWSPDGTRLVSSSGDATLRIHDTVHPISRRLQAEQRKERIARQTERLEALVRELGDPAAAARQLCAEAEDTGSRQAARRACLLRWVSQND